MLSAAGSSPSTLQLSNAWPPWPAPRAVQLASWPSPCPGRQSRRAQALRAGPDTGQYHQQAAGGSRGRGQQLLQTVEEPVAREHVEQLQEHSFIQGHMVAQPQQPELSLQPSTHEVASNFASLQGPGDSQASSSSQPPFQDTDIIQSQSQGLRPQRLSPFAVAALRLRLTPQRFMTTLAFLFAVILVNFGIETALDHYLGDNVFGSLLCIFVGGGTLTYLRLKQFKVAKILLRGFWS